MSVKICSEEGCCKVVFCRGLCVMHYQRLLKKINAGKEGSKERCSVPDCGQPVYAKGLCNKHYQRLRKIGSYLDEDLKNDSQLSVKERLEKNGVVKENGCIEWAKQRDTDGYGKISIKNYPYAVHRVAYEIYNGPIPPGMLVCHKCDNPSCFNPEHLFLGSSKDNLQDMVNKGRKPRGEKVHNSKLTEEQVREIKIRLNAGEKVSNIAEDYAVHGRAIRLIKDGINWKHIKV